VKCNVAKSYNTIQKTLSIANLLSLPHLPYKKNKKQTTINKLWQIICNNLKWISKYLMLKGYEQKTNWKNEKMKRKEEDKRAKHVVDFFIPSKKETQQITQKKNAKENFNVACTT
jgi:hypothetical protein